MVPFYKVYCFYYIVGNKKIAIKKALQQRPKGLKLSWLPLLESFRTFKGNIDIENIRLIS